MLDVLRQRLSREEQEAYDMFDGRAMLASQFVVWPTIVAIACYFSGMTNTALIFAGVAAVALPILLVMGRKARILRESAERRYRAIVLGSDEP
ncbi:MAG: hypothetical protein ACR2PG_07095 [Hyphomicrobiaceae bacterium]